LWILLLLFKKKTKTRPVMCDGTLAGPALLDLCKVVLAKGSAEQQNALVRIATNSLQCEWATDAATNTQRVEPLACSNCVDTSCSLGHLAECAGPQATLFRADLARDILAVLHSAPQADSWCHQGKIAADQRLSLHASGQ
jgi:hypothetical protein